jgi:hypothetical protein
MLLGTNPTAGSFTIQLEVNDRQLILDIHPKKFGSLEAVEFNLPKMVEKKIPFHVGTLASAHHRLSLKNWTEKAATEIGGVNQFMLKCQLDGLLTANESKEVVKALGLKKIMIAEMGAED